MRELEINESELIRLSKTLARAQSFLTHRDNMNGALHLEEVRFSPLTKEVQVAYILVGEWLVKAKKVS